MTANAFPIRIDSLAYREADTAYRTGVHQQRAYQWLICLHGGITASVDGKSHELHPEESLLVPPRVKREMWCRRKAPGYVLCLFDAQRLDLAPLVGRVQRLPVELREDLLALVGELHGETRPDSAWLTSALVVRLLIGQLRGARRTSGQGEGLSPLNAGRHQEVVTRAEVFMGAQLHRTLLRGTIADEVGVSEPHLARLFRATTGKTVLGRLTEMRLARAKALLLETTQPVTAIASAVGLSSFSHFSRLFKRSVGVAPSDYRRARGRSWA